jgi:shikimate dehydrogenase/3-dehydroquinate dehydratase type I
MNLAVSLFGDQPEVLAERLEQLASRHQWVELRLDRIPEATDWRSLQQHRHGLKLILACVPASEGGQFQGDVAQWRHRIESALLAFGADCYVDVPPCFADSEGLAADIPRIWSWHQSPGGNPTDLESIHQGLLRYAQIDRGDVLKIVAWADHHAQALAVLPLYRLQGPPLVAFAQGPGGQATRLWALALGAPWTYACWQGEATAPGQWSEHQVRRRKSWQGTPLLGVLGDPVAHSRSPRLWQTGFAILRAYLQAESPLGAAAAYAEALYLPLQQASLANFADDYQDQGFRAFSVTAPLKVQALELADQADRSAQAIGAANLLVREGKLWRACNTDGLGALDALYQAGLQPTQPVLVLGAGGAARAVAYEALRRGHPVTIAARKLSAAHQLVQQFSAFGSIRAVDLVAADLLDGPPGALIQATPVGSARLAGDPLANFALPSGWIFLDMVYPPTETQLLRRARLAGNQTLGGQHMLLAQMVEQFERVCGFTLPLAPLRLALDHDLDLQPKPIYLIGPRASGKSTLGRRLAKVLGWDFIDADGELEQRHRRRIIDWIPADIDGFRNAEAALLKEFTSMNGVVIAVGGGVVERPESVDLLARQDCVLGLRAGSAELLKRQAAGNRPALTPLSLTEECKLLEERRNPLYEKACRSRWINVDGKESVAFRRLLESLNLIV